MIDENRYFSLRKMERRSPPAGGYAIADKHFLRGNLGDELRPTVGDGSVITLCSQNLKTESKMMMINLICDTI
ncbi:hypothetical protein H6G36_26480 [Anabaena minutissima FACHB-250]|nr:hypothetical protein [Anabaena minutissima FACHB-250]